MDLKDVSIKQELEDICRAITTNISNFPNSMSGDIFLVEDLANHIGKNVEITRNSNGGFFDGTLGSVKIDIFNFKTQFASILYVIKLKEFDELIYIESNSIEVNTQNQKNIILSLGIKIKNMMMKSYGVLPLYKSLLN